MSNWMLPTPVLYGLTRDELRYILDPKEVYGEDFPGETFRVLKEMVMGYEKERHMKDVHRGQEVEWKKVKQWQIRVEIVTTKTLLHSLTIISKRISYVYFFSQY